MKPICWLRIERNPFLGLTTRLRRRAYARGYVVVGLFTYELVEDTKDGETQNPTEQIKENYCGTTENYARHYCKCVSKLIVHHAKSQHGRVVDCTSRAPWLVVREEEAPIVSAHLMSLTLRMHAHSMVPFIWNSFISSIHCSSHCMHSEGRGSLCELEGWRQIPVWQW